MKTALSLQYIGLSLCALVLTACGGGGGGGSSSSSSSGSTSGSSSENVTLSGNVTYTDFDLNTATGIVYNNPQQKPVRGAVIELRNSAGTVLDSANTSAAGAYSFSVAANSDVRVLVKAQLGPPDDINTTLVDNTRNNALYSLFADISVGASDQTEDLNAETVAGSNSFIGTRAGSPFNILDVIYQSQELMRSVDSSVSFPLLTVNWSENNSTSNGTVSNGGIGTSFYSDRNLYILGLQSDDSDEYDDGVIAHEWGHYFEAVLSRSDNLGGPHGQGDLLHPSVAYSEGFATALSSMIRDDSLYIDTSAVGSPSVTDIESDSDGDTTRTTEGTMPLFDGYYSEASVQEVLYDLFDSGSSDDDAAALGFAPIYRTLTGDLKDSPAFITIFNFLHYLKIEASSSAAVINAVAEAENIDATNANEFEDPTDTEVVPLYTVLTDGVTATQDTNAANLQTFSSYGSANANNLGGNKLLNQRFFRATAGSAGCYTVTATPTGGGDLTIIFTDNNEVDAFIGGSAEQLAYNLSAGEVTSFAVGAFSNDVTFTVLFASTPSAC